MEGNHLNVQGLFVEATVILILIIASGAFAMSEMALVSARRGLLEKLRKEGKRGADSAIQLSDEPGRFLSTIQLGITLVGVLAAALGGTTLADEFADQLEKMAHLKPYADTIALGCVVLATTYLSLVVGELVPKRIALTNPEAISCFIAPIIRAVARMVAPLIKFLNISTEAVLKLVGIEDPQRKTLSELEIHAMVEEGKRAGLFEKAEHEMLMGVFSLDQRKVSMIMTPATELIWLDIEDSPEKLIARVAEHPHSRFPVCRGTVDNFIGIVRARDLLTNWAKGNTFDLGALTRKVLIVPDSRSALAVLEDFRAEKYSAAVVMDEYGAVRGLVTVSDILRSIVGNVPIAEEMSRGDFVEESPNIYIVDGLMSIDEFSRQFGDGEPTRGPAKTYQTVAGLIVHLLGRVPERGEKLEWGELHIEVLDMDAHRIDKLRVTRKS